MGSASSVQTASPSAGEAMEQRVMRRTVSNEGAANAGSGNGMGGNNTSGSGGTANTGGKGGSAGAGNMAGSSSSASTGADQCKPIGWATRSGRTGGAASVTGGGNAAPNVVTSYADLAKFASDGQARRLILQKNASPGPRALRDRQGFVYRPTMQHRRCERLER